MLSIDFFFKRRYKDHHPNGTLYDFFSILNIGEDNEKFLCEKLVEAKIPEAETFTCWRESYNYPSVHGNVDRLDRLSGVKFACVSEDCDLKDVSTNPLWPDSWSKEEEEVFSRELEDNPHVSIPSLCAGLSFQLKKEGTDVRNQLLPWLRIKVLARVVNGMYAMLEDSKTREGATLSSVRNAVKNTANFRELTDRMLREYNVTLRQEEAETLAFLKITDGSFIHERTLNHLARVVKGVWPAGWEHVARPALGMYKNVPWSLYTQVGLQDKKPQQSRTRGKFEARSGMPLSYNNKASEDEASVDFTGLKKKKKKPKLDKGDSAEAEPLTRVDVENEVLEQVMVESGAFDSFGNGKVVPG